MNNEYVMYCIFSMEAIKAMGGNRGKLASMAGHAYLHTWWDAQYGSGDMLITTQKEMQANAYMNSGLAKKVTLVVPTTEILQSLYDQLKHLPYGSTLVVDRGLTVFEGPTTVCVGFGPINRDDIPDVLKPNAGVVKLLL